MTRWILMTVALCAGMVLQAGRLDVTFAEETARALDAIEATQEKNLQANYVAVLNRPIFPECGKVKKAVFYRKCDADGFVSLQLDIHLDDNGPSWTFVKNRDGQFAVENRAGWAVKGQDFQRLSQLEALANPVYRFLMRILSVQQSETKWNGRSVDRYVFRTPKSLDRVAVTGEDITIPLQDIWLWLAENPDEFKRVHATTWEYLIDQETGLLVSRRSFNGDGKLLTDVNLGHFELVTDWGKYPDLFAMPEKLRAEVLTAHNFFMLLDWDSVFSQPNAPGAPTSRREGLRAQENWFQRLTGVLSRHAVPVFVILAALFLGSALYLRMRE